MNFKRNILMSAVAAMIALAALSMSGAASAQSLTGGGSTFINPVMQTWIANYQKASGVSINYQAIGSGAGINGLINKTLDFAGSDAPMKNEEITQAGSPVLHLPVVIGTVCVAYNIPGIGPGIHLSGPVLADIYLGKVTNWSDPEITKLSPGTKFPNQPIYVTHRSDGSGTTFILTDYLSKVSDDFKSTVGAGKSVKWPLGLGGKGNEGVAGLIKAHPYSIGYIELAYAVQNVIPYAAIQNTKGKFIYPSVETGTAAADGAKIPNDFRVSITNTPNAGGYPITSFSWVIVYQNSNQGPALQKFLTYILTTGQDANAALDYGTIPQGLRDREIAKVNSIK